MGKATDPTVTLLNTSAADVAQNNATYVDLDTCDKAVFSIDLTGTATVTLDFDLHGDNSVIVQEAFTADAQKVLDDPCGRVKAWSNGVGANEAAVVKMRKIYNSGR